MNDERFYDPDHDALWAAVKRLIYVTTVLGLAVLCIAVALILGAK
jgi:hypothetical protein